MPFSNHDVVPDSPINNFATWNPLFNGQGTPPFKDGNLTLGGDPSTWNDVLATFSVDSGIWYWECKGHDQYVFFGIASQNYTTGSDPHTRSNQISIYGVNGDNYGENAGTYFTYNGNDIISIVVDLEATQRAIHYYKNGTTSSVATINIPSSYKSISPLVIISGQNSVNMRANFGQDPTFGGASNLPASAGSYTADNGIGTFAYQPPAGALALCTQNIPSGPINLANDDVPSDYMKAVTYTGQTVGGAMTSWDGTTGTVDVGFQPDLVWIKARGTNYSHNINDSVRGVGQYLMSNSTLGSQGTNVGWTVAELLNQFNSTNFRIGNNANINASGQPYVAWCWRAAGAPADNQALIVDTDGSLITKTTADLKTETNATITPSKVSANRKSGFSIVKYTGTGSAATVPHGLSAAPELIITKGLTTNYNWNVCTSLFPDCYLEQNTTSAKNSNSSRYISAGIDKNTLTDYVQFNQSGVAHIAYCWHSVSGYSKISSYVGNGSLDGPYVELGFRPAWVMVKNISTSGSGHSSWMIFDSARQPYNTDPANNRLEADTANAEDGDGRTGSGGNGVDMLSNGFKVRAGNWYDTNHSGSNYIFMAFAEQPQNAPSNAR